MSTICKGSLDFLEKFVKFPNIVFFVHFSIMSDNVSQTYLKTGTL